MIFKRTFPVLVLLLAPSAVGCGSTTITCDDLAKTCGCEGKPACPIDNAGGVGGASGSSGAGGSDGGGAGGSGGGTLDAGDARTERMCDGSKRPSEDACVIDPLYGVFVSPKGNDSTGMGSKAAPYKTLAKGLAAAKAGGKRLYVCDDGTGYAEQVTIDMSLDGVNGFGGFKCSDWTYATSNRSVVRPAASPALTIKGTSAGATLEDFEFDAPDANATGSSSIASIIDTAANVTLRRVRFIAGNGAPGQAGADGAQGSDAPVSGGPQTGANATCPSVLSIQAGGGWTGPTTCGSRGGNGGLATQGLDGSAGLAGIPQTNVDPPNVNNRGSEGATGADGLPGSPGVPGTIGMASAASGTFSASGYAAAPAAGSGTDGNTGQGGGGGGASNATGTCIGASGGAGGMGGCGGKAGGGASGGGASVALLSWMSTNVVLDNCELVSKAGGGGGKGGNGGAGGLGRDGAVGGAAFSDDAGPPVGNGGHGGIGGNGGAGGPGAGGNGGPSYALAYKGQPASNTQSTLTAGTGGAKGIGGTSHSSTVDGGLSTTNAPDGAVGQSAAQFAIP